MDEKPWWDQVSLARVNEWSPWSAVGGIFLREAARGGPPAREIDRGGRLRDDKVTSLVFAKELGLRLLFSNEGGDTEVFGNEDTCVTWQIRGNSIHVESVTRSESGHRAISEWCDNHLVDHTEDSPEGPIFTLQRGMEGIRLLRLGEAGVPLVRTNYAPESIADFDHVASELKSSSPCGRIVLMTGPPGTGKTHMIRALLRESPSGIFILVPPPMLEAIGDPTILPAILEVRHEASGPIVFVLEDADMCFVSRGADNLGSIAALLNLGDGILGSLLDMRILATTNANKLEVDKAVIRTGRLCRHLELRCLTAPQAATALGAICNLTDEQLEPYRAGKGAFAFGAATTLGDVYGVARKLGWEPPESPGVKIGRRRHRRRRHSHPTYVGGS